ncbi:hypothetical protein Tco_0884834, partial [Tanacetum coccineum]
MFRSAERPADKVCDVIVDTVKLRLLGLKIKCSLEVDKAATIWKLPINGDGEKWDSTFGGSSTIGIVDISIGMTFFSIPMLVITLWVYWLFLSFYDSQSFLHSVYGLTWFSHGFLDSDGIRGGWIWSDNRLFSLSFFGLRNSAFRLRMGCKPSLDAIYIWFMVLFLCHNCLAYIVHMVGWIFVWVRIKGVWENTSRDRFLSAFIIGDKRLCCCISHYFKKHGFTTGTSRFGVLGNWGFGYPVKDLDVGLHNGSGSGFGFWKCNKVNIIDNGTRSWFDIWYLGYTCSVGFSGSRKFKESGWPKVSKFTSSGLMVYGQTSVILLAAFHVWFLGSLNMCQVKDIDSNFGISRKFA